MKDMTLKDKIIADMKLVIEVETKAAENTKPYSYNRGHCEGLYTLAKSVLKKLESDDYG